MQKIKEIKKAKTFDEVVRDLVLKELGVEPEMFGVDKGKIKPYTMGQDGGSLLVVYDTYALIEYFLGTSIGAQVKKLLDKGGYMP
ncbi:MAG: hypothetical protein LM573_05265, partial [Thermofilum sp.]|nr:hypothetical protein [Thermofilum sp.]